jgi:hypothetical protein
MNTNTHVFTDKITCPTNPSKIQRRKPPHTTKILYTTLADAAENKTLLKANATASRRTRVTKPTRHKTIIYNLSPKSNLEQPIESDTG